MKINEIIGKEKAESTSDLIRSISKGVFTKDGSDLKTGTFICTMRNLTSLDGCPQEISGNFSCGTNKLTSLKGGPPKTGVSFYCDKNKLKSLEGCPQEIGGHFFCSDNKLTSLNDIHKHLKLMDGTFDATHNPISSHVLGLLKIPGCRLVKLDNQKVRNILNKYLPLGDLIDCQEELIEAGFARYAQL